MKAEERKHLEHNTLAEGLGKLKHTINEGLPRSVWLVVGGVAVVLVLFYTWSYFSNKAQQQNASLWYRWDQLDSNTEIDKQVAGSKELQELILRGQGGGLGAIKEGIDLERLKSFVKENSGTVQGRLARFQLARLYLYEGLKNLGRDEGRTRNEARTKLEEAAKEYALLIKEARDIPVLHQEALLNCGKARESLEEISEVTKLYEELRNAYPKSAAGKTAEENLKRLADDADNIRTLGKHLGPIKINEPTPLPPGHP